MTDRLKRFWTQYQSHLATLFVLLLAASVRFTSLNVFRAVDEEDRWAWAVDFYQALLNGDLAATLVGDGYPGIFPVWLETIWLFLVTLYRSIQQGGWIGPDGINHLIHTWGRLSNLSLQRFPVVLINTLLVVAIFLYVRRLFGGRVGLLAAIFISLDPFYLSDSRVNRAEALLAGLMTLSALALLLAYREENRKQFIISAVIGGLAWLTKSQALVLIPMFGAISLLWFLRYEPDWQTAIKRTALSLLAWIGIAAAIFLLLWPATWTVPGPTFQLMFNFITRKVGEEGVKLFFMGQTLLDDDPGIFFYPVIFLLRITPLVLIGLCLGLFLLVREQQHRLWRAWRAWFDQAGIWVLVAFALLYMGGMTLGSHKQDRFLMTIFPALGILAALAFVMAAQRWRWSSRQIWLAGGAVLALQLATALPYHPYYFSYFNPLVGGGPVATKITRVGWGEGFDQIADYLNGLDNAESLQVASRFSAYYFNFKPEIIDLDAKGEWVQADKIVFYIQQTQRMLDPSPGVIRYFQQHVEPEKLIRFDWIDYAWIYPNPITYPADPQLDRIEGQLALFGYRWQAQPDGAEATLIWENLGQQNAPLALRLQADTRDDSDWLTCTIAPGFEAAAQQPGEVVESRCSLSSAAVPPGLYNLQVGVQQNDVHWQPLDFASGWAALNVSDTGTIERVSTEVAFAQLADQALPASATHLERAFAYQVRLLGYTLSPEDAQPGDTLSLTLYWQAQEPLIDEVEVTIQGFIGDERIVLHNGPPQNGERPTPSWQPGEVIADEWSIPLPPDVVSPALIRLDVGLFNPDTLIPLQVRNLEGVDIPGAITEIRIEPEQWPTYEGDQPLAFTFANAVDLIGQDLSQAADSNQIDLALYWKAVAPLDQDYTAFVHLLKPDGTLAAQSDVPPAHGRYPVSAWQPGNTVLSYHHFDLPPGTYTLLAGLYHPGDWTRLAAQDANGTILPDNAAPIGQLTLP